MMWTGMDLSSRFVFFFSSRRRHTRSDRDWSSDVCSSDLTVTGRAYEGQPVTVVERIRRAGGAGAAAGLVVGLALGLLLRSEERRVGKEGRSRGSPDH